MSIKQAPYYWLECDGLNDDGTICGIKSTEGGDYAAWDSESTAIGEAECSDWTIAEDADPDQKHFCPEHADLTDDEETE